MNASSELNELAAALAVAQGKFQNPDRNRTVKVKTKAGGEYSFKYATLDSILEMLRPIMADSGLAVVQPATTSDGAVIVETRLMHSSGQWLEDSLAISFRSADPQELGSLITYMRRYALCSMLGIASEEDDDGNAASGNTVTAARNKPKAETKPDKKPEPPGRELGNLSAKEMLAELQVGVVNCDFPKIAGLVDECEKRVAEGRKGWAAENLKGFQGKVCDLIGVQIMGASELLVVDYLELLRNLAPGLPAELRNNVTIKADERLKTLQAAGNPKE